MVRVALRLPWAEKHLDLLESSQTCQPPCGHSPTQSWQGGERLALCWGAREPGSQGAGAIFHACTGRWWLLFIPPRSHLPD